MKARGWRIRWRAVAVYVLVVAALAAAVMGWPVALWSLALAVMLLVGGE